MNTLPRAITAQWFATTESYWSLRRHWHGLLQSERRHELNAAHHLLYLALLGRDWRREFTPPSNAAKLANGAFVSWSFFGALDSIHYGFQQPESLAPFDGRVTPAMVAALRPFVPRLSYFERQPEQFQPGQWPFEAYILPVKPSITPEAAGQHG